MYVCLCKGITDRDIEQAVQRGAVDFRSVREELGVSTQCGKCARLARVIVDDSLKARVTEHNCYDATAALA